MSAFSCEPERGSEPGAGWAWSRAAALCHEAWVLTRTKHAPAIQQALQKEPHLKLCPVYVDLPAWARSWQRGQHGVRLYYLLWQILAFREGRRLHREIGFDVAHHLTFAVDWMPAGVAWVPGLPFIWGPVGGATGTPWALRRWLGWRGVVSEALREITTRPMRRLFGDLTARRAALIIAQNRDVARRFSYRPAVIVEPNVALEKLPEPTPRAPRDPDKPRVAVFAGRLIPWKGLRLAIATLAEPETADWELHVYGDGSERRVCEGLAERLGVKRRVIFHGPCPRTEVLAAVATADAFLFPSMHDSAPWAVGEAVSLGIPVVCLDRGGPAVIVDDWSGYRVLANTAAPAALARALEDAAGRRRGMRSTRWLARRLPSMLDGWYESATASRKARAHAPDHHGRDPAIVL